MRRSGVRASPGAKVLVQRENSKSRQDSTRTFQSAKLISKSHLINVYCHGNWMRAFSTEICMLTKRTPLRGIEPRPRRWERRILATRPQGMSSKCVCHHSLKLVLSHEEIWCRKMTIFVRKLKTRFSRSCAIIGLVSRTFIFTMCAIKCGITVLSSSGTVG